jgi:hypothetical protein
MQLLCENVEGIIKLIVGLNGQYSKNLKIREFRKLTG